MNTNNEVHPGLTWLNNKYPGYNFKTFYDWYVYKVHSLHGATLRQNQAIDNNNIRATKHTGGSTEMPPHKGETDEPDPPRKNKKKIRHRLDMEKIFKFNYNDMLLCEPNKKFDKVKHIVFNHECYDYKQQCRYDDYVDKYYNLSEDDLDRINYIYQRFSTYIYKNKLKSKYVDGSIICNVALMTAHYVKTGEIKTDFDFFNMFDDNEYDFDDDNLFHLFLIRHCFISKNDYYKKYVGGKFYKDWWAVCHLLHRWSDKDMKTKVVCRGFRDGLGRKIIIKY